MNEKWLKQQAEEISMALARSGIRWAMPVDDAVRGQKVFVTDSTNVAAYIDHTHYWYLPLLGNRSAACARRLWNTVSRPFV